MFRDGCCLYLEDIQCDVSILMSSERSAGSKEVVAAKPVKVETSEVGIFTRFFH
jgi:hypothetical protein